MICVVGECVLLIIFPRFIFVFFRELPGFASTRILLSTVAEELDTWRGQVEDAIRQLFDSYSETANLLSQKLTLQVIYI